MPRPPRPDQAGAASMAGKTVLVTGGTSGIGKATADGLAGLGARVGIVGRDIERARLAAADIRARHGGGPVDVFVADLSSQADVRRLADEASAAYPRLDVLVNNVGGFWATRHLTVDGLERTFAVNHLTPYLLTNLLIERLCLAAGARVVTVSSGAHTGGRLDFEDLQATRSHSGARAYSQSKLANIMFTYELARRLARAEVTANALQATPNAPPLLRPGWSTTTLDAATAHSAAYRRPAGCNQRPGRVHVGAYLGAVEHVTTNGVRVAGRRSRGCVSGWCSSELETYLPQDREATAGESVHRFRSASETRRPALEEGTHSLCEVLGAHQRHLPYALALQRRGEVV